MEKNCLKSDVYVNDPVYNQTVEQAIDLDFTLPDYFPEISKILKCRAVPFISSKAINGRTLSVDGCVALTLIYADNDGILSSFEYQVPFNKLVEVGEQCENGNLYCTAKCDYINCRALTNRKVDVHGAISIHCCVTKRKAEEIISDIDDQDIEVKRGTVSATLPMGHFEKYTLIDEDIDIGNCEIQTLLRYDARVYITESKLIEDKVVVKGNLLLSALYCTAQSRDPQCLKTEIPFSQIVDMPGVNSDCNADTDAEIAYLELKPKSNSSGEMKLLSLDAKILVSSDAYCDNDVTVVYDSYSRKNPMNLCFSKVHFKKLRQNISDAFHNKQDITLDDGVLSVCDIWSDVQSVSVKQNGNEMFVTGTVLVGIVYINANEETTYVEKEIPFEYRAVLNESYENFASDPKLEITSIGYTIMQNNGIEIRMDIKINAAVYSENTVSLLTGAEVQEDQKMQNNNSHAMMIYFSNSGESIWDIAKRYNSSMEEIQQINSLDSETVDRDQMIFIPVE